MLVQDLFLLAIISPNYNTEHPVHIWDMIMVKSGRQFAFGFKGFGQIVEQIWRYRTKGNPGHQSLQSNKHMVVHQTYKNYNQI